MAALNTVAEMLQRVERNLEKVGYHSKQEITIPGTREEISRADERLARLENRMERLEKENDSKMRGLAEAVKSKLIEISRSRN